MFKKVTFVFIVLAVILLCISNVSAEESLGLNVSNFDDLASQINQTPEGETLFLESDYRFSNASENYILIDKSIAIDGKNHKIDAGDVKRVFWIKADNVSVKNINFVNARSTLAGGVISWWGDEGILENCSFENNSAVSAGGAVLWKGDFGSISECNFSDNKVNYGAAATLTDGDGFDPSQLHIQIVQSEGGALYISGNNVSVAGCNFCANAAQLNGGAVSITGSSNVTVSSSKFRNNRAGYNGGAIDWNSNNATIINSTFESNSPKSLFLNTNALIMNSTFDRKDSIENWYDVSYVNVVFSDIGSFEDLQAKVNDTPEGGILVLDKDYEYVNGSNKGVLIAKSIVIDGAGHTLNGNKLSRMFNVTADNVIIRNITFMNGNAFGRYGGIAGGGAIYWSGANGIVENCQFTNNTGSGIEDDPFDKEESYVDEDGNVIHVIRFRPMGAKVNEGGAIVWNGTNGTVSNCIFTRNTVGYPNYGGAIMWRGDGGKVIRSEFYENGAWCGSAICWDGDDGIVLSSVIANSTFLGGGIYWFGKNGNIHDSILLQGEYKNALYATEAINADYNFWGDTLENPNGVEKIDGLNNWIVIKFSNNGQFVEKGQKVIIRYDLTTLRNRNGEFSAYMGLINYSSQMVYTADKTGFLDIGFSNGKINVEISLKDAIVSKNLKTYYAKKISYSVKLYNAFGKLVGKKVKFTINNRNYYATTSKNGVATLKINLKPGKYIIYTSYGKIKVKNKILVKTTLITKNVSKKVGKSAKFGVKLLNVKSKKVVKIKFKGKTYKIRTNSKGIVAFKIPSNLKVGKYTIKTTYNGLTNTNRITVKK